MVLEARVDLAAVAQRCGEWVPPFPGLYYARPVYHLLTSTVRKVSLRA